MNIAQSNRLRKGGILHNMSKIILIATDNVYAAEHSRPGGITDESGDMPE